MYALILIASGLIAAGATFGLNWLALKPWRANQEAHWTERARLSFPVRMASASNLVYFPGISMFLVSLLWPSSSPLWVAVGVATLLGAVCGSVPADRAVFPRIDARDYWRQVAVTTVNRFMVLFVFLCGTACMPTEFGPKVWLVAAVVIGVGIFWVRGGAYWFFAKVGFIAPAPERLQRIVDEKSRQTGIAVRNVFIMRSSFAQALAVIQLRTLIYTERFLEILSDEQIAAVTVHELAHLTESRTAVASRYVNQLTFLPWLFFNPVMHTFGMFGLFGLLGCSVAAPKIYQKVCRKLEKRADQMVSNVDADGTVYASALTQLHIDSLIPAVMRKKTTHPDLYDRVLAAGVTPDYPRPEPAQMLAWPGTLVAALFGMLLPFYALRMI